VALLAAMVAALALAPNALALRLFAALALAASVGFGDPLVAWFVARRVTGVLTFYRFFWLLPLPIMLGTTFAGGLDALRARFAPRRWLALGLALLPLAGFYAVATERLVISEANEAKLVFPPRVKLWARALQVAEEVCRIAPAGKHVLASQGVLLELPTIHHCGHPLIADPRWLSMSVQDEEIRSTLVRYVGEPGDIPAEKAGWFLEMLRWYDLDVVVVSKEAQQNARAKSLVRAADFEKVATIDWDQIYARTSAATRDKYDAVAAAICKASRGGPGASALAPFGLSRTLAARGCVQAVAAPARWLGANKHEIDDVLRLERFTYLDSDATAKDHAFVLSQISARRIEIVVLNTPALGNKHFKAMLKQLGFRSVQVVAGHTILRRTLPAA
jgi:hypothetical protein